MSDQLRSPDPAGEAAPAEAGATSSAGTRRVEDLEAQLAQRTVELRRVEQALRESEARCRLLFEHGQIGIYRTSPEGRILEANPALVAMLGFPSFEALAARDLEQEGFPEESPRAEFKALLERAGEVRDHEAVWRRADGSCIVVRENARVIRDADGRVVCFEGTAQDVTAHHRAELAARQERVLLRTVIDHLPDAIYVKDAQGRKTLSNRLDVELMGMRTEAEVLGKTDFEVYGAESAARYAADDYQVMETGEPILDREEVHVDAHGRSRWLLTSKLPLKEGTGAVIGLVGIGHDITARKQAEDEVRRLNAELESRVRQRTAQLELANRELEAFAYSVSHDLRAPLRGIDGWSSVLLEDAGDRLDAEARECLHRVRAEARRLGQLIDDLLKLSRVTRCAMRLEPVDLSGLAEGAVARLRQAQPQRQVESAIAPGLRVVADAGLIEVVVTNLLDNAWKFTDRTAGARIEVGRTRREGQTVFFVRDNGVGFDPRHARQLFAPFQRMHPTSDYPGNGVGLATVHRIVTRHGGRIWAEACVGQGATFYFTLGAG